MRASAQVRNPNGVELELTLTMTIAQWKQVQEFIEAKDASHVPTPVYQIGRAINSVVAQVVTTASESIEAFK